MDGLYARLRDGRSIRTVSALLLQLIQTSSHNVRVESSRIAKARHQSMTLRRHDSGITESKEALLDEHYEEEVRLYAGGLDAPAKAARTIVLFLTQRCVGSQHHYSGCLAYLHLIDPARARLRRTQMRQNIVRYWTTSSLIF